MRKSIVALIIGGVGLAGFALYSYVMKQKNLLEQFTYKITKFKISTINMQLIKGDIGVQFTSISDVEIIINEFYLDFYFNGKRVGYLQDESPFVIPARGTTEIPFAYTLNPKLIIGNAADILAYTLKQKDAAISVQGKVSIKSGFVKAVLPVRYDTTIQEILRS